jgi:hypothetical protein
MEIANHARYQKSEVTVRQGVCQGCIAEEMVSVA